MNPNFRQFILPFAETSFKCIGEMKMCMQLNGNGKWGTGYPRAWSSKENKKDRQSEQAVLSVPSETDNLEFVPSEFCSNAIIYFFGFINKLLVCWQEQASLSITQSLSLF